MAEPLTLDVWSDLVCPWCFLGKRRLEKALAALPEGAVQVRWRAYELQPGLPPEGIDARKFFSEKFGTPERQQQIFQRVIDAGKDDGVKFDFAKVHAPNTRLGHRAVKVVRTLAGDAAATQAKEAFFKGHFEEGEDLAKLGTLLTLLERHRVPVDVAQVRERLESGEAADAVLEDEQLAQQLGISGVPLFLGPGRFAVSGAQPPEVLKQFLESVQARVAAGL